MASQKLYHSSSVQLEKPPSHFDRHKGHWQIAYAAWDGAYIDNIRAERPTVSGLLNGLYIFAYIRSEGRNDERTATVHEVCVFVYDSPLDPPKDAVRRFAPGKDYFVPSVETEWPPRTGRCLVMSNPPAFQAMVLGALRMKMVDTFPLEDTSKYTSTPVAIPDPAIYTMGGTQAYRMTVRVRSNAERFGNTTGIPVGTTSYVKLGGEQINGGASHFDEYYMEHTHFATGLIDRYYLNAALSNVNTELQWSEMFDVDGLPGDMFQFGHSPVDVLTRSRQIDLPAVVDTEFILGVPNLNPPEIIVFDPSPHLDPVPPPYYEAAMQCELVALTLL